MTYNMFGGTIIIIIITEIFRVA